MRFTRECGEAKKACKPVKGKVRSGSLQGCVDGRESEELLKLSWVKDYASGGCSASP